MVFPRLAVADLPRPVMAYPYRPSGFESRLQHRQPRQRAPGPPIPHVSMKRSSRPYAARAFNWRGLIASHCWISVKPRGAASYTVYQVVGWRTYRGLPALSIAQDIPDRNWFNAAPELILDLRGLKAEKLIHPNRRCLRAQLSLCPALHAVARVPIATPFPPMSRGPFQSLD